MKRFIMAFLTSIMMLAGATTLKADITPAPEHAASQGAFAILGHTHLYLDRKGVEKGPVALPSIYGDGTIKYSNEYLVGTWDSANIIWLYHVATGTQCTRDVGTSCKEGLVFNGYAFAACPDNMSTIRMALDCSAHDEFIGGAFDAPESLTNSSTEIIFTANGENRVGHFGSINPSLASAYGTGLTDLMYVRYHASSSKVYFNGNDGLPGIFYKDYPAINTWTSQTLLYLPTNTRYLSANDTHLFASSYISEAYLVDIANQSFVTLSMNESRANALSPDTAYIVDSGPSIVTRAYDLQGNEKNFSPLPIVGYSIAYIEPHVAPVCNNGLIEPGELCDGSDFDGATCIDHGFDGGEFGCNLSCDNITYINCYSCGDGVLNSSEDCDGNELGIETCSDYGYASGNLSCNASCEHVTTACYTCGDGFIEGAEQCESNDLNGGSCTTEGFVSGTIACGSNCMYDTSACSSCGDNVINGTDICDGNAINDVCQTLGVGFTDGTLTCNNTCDGYDTSACTTCGNGTVENGEECDGNDLDQENCPGLGFTGGNLDCYANCTYDTSSCNGAPTEFCGNGIVEGTEECDDGERLNGDGCDENCRLEPDPALCGNNIVEGIEECDGTDLADTTCESLGYDTGIVYCENNCRLNISCTYSNFQPANFTPEPGALPPPDAFSPEQAETFNEITDERVETCVPSMDGSDLIMTTPANGYCPIELDFGGIEPSLKSKQGKIFAMIYKPENSLNDETPLMRITPTGDISFESGGHMRAQLWVTPTVTFGDNTLIETTEASMSLRMEFLSVHPDPPDPSNANGRFLLIEIASGLGTYCSMQQPDACAVVPSGNVYVLDLDKIEDSLGDLGRTPSKSSGCAIAGSDATNTEIPVFIMIILALAIRIRRQ